MKLITSLLIFSICTTADASVLVQKIGDSHKVISTYKAITLLKRNPRNAQVLHCERANTLYVYRCTQLKLAVTQKQYSLKAK